MTSIYAEEESLVQQASAAYTANEFTTIAAAARHFGTRYDCVKNRINGCVSYSNRQPTNLLLSTVEEEGFLIWLQHWDVLGTHATIQELEWECNCILASRHTGSGDPPLCGDHWTTRFLQRHPEFSLRTENPKELERQAAEDPIALAAWFEEYRRTIGVYDIMVGDTYNYNEIGVHLGIGKKEKVITSISKALRITAAKYTNQESATIAETISGDGTVLPPLVILAGKTIQKRWCTQTVENLPGNYLLAVSDTAYINLLLK
jgi:hypothetical protein